MKRRSLWFVAWLVSAMVLLLTPAVRADPEPTATPTAAPTSLSPSEPTPTPTAVVQPEPATFKILSVEPTSLVNVSGGILSIYGDGFTESSVARLIGYGLLDTTFINATALRAQVPAGLGAGTYDLQVSDGTTTASLSRALTVLLATPTPRPPAEPTVPSPPAPGRPILTVRNYTVEPAQVRAGQEFVVTIEIYNNGSRAGENTMAVFPGDTFLPVGENGHMIWQLHINHTATVSQRLRAPSTLTTGVYQVQVNLSANDFSGEHYDYPQTVAVEVTGASPTGSTAGGQPKVFIEAAETHPRVLVPGEPFSLTLRLVNQGRRTALSLLARCASDEMAISMLGSDTVAVPRIDVDGVITLTLPLMLADVDKGGRQNMAIALEYADYGGGSYSAQQNVAVDINTSLTKKPQLLIRRYTTQPDVLSPGDTFTLTLVVANVGGGDAQRITLALGGDKGEALEPFIPQASGNVLFIQAVAHGSTVEVTQSLVVDGAAEPKAYHLPLALAYDDPRGVRQSDTQRLSLVVRHRPEIQVNFYQKPEMVNVGSPIPLSLEVINVGRGALNVVSLDIVSSQGEIQHEGGAFVGPLDAGGSAPLDVVLTPYESGAAELTVTLQHRDEFNQRQVLTRTLSLTVDNASSMPVPGESADPALNPPEATLGRTLVRVIRGLLGLGS